MLTIFWIGGGRCWSYVVNIIFL